MIYVFDLDDTLCETDLYSEEYINNFIKEHNLPYKQITKKARYAEMLFDWSDEVRLQWYKDYGDKMMTYFPSKNGAVEFVNKLYAEGNTIIISTARNSDWHTDPEQMTKDWAKNVGLKYHKLYFGRKDKEEICFIENADVFVDDDLEITSRVVGKLKGKCRVYLSTTRFNEDLEAPQGVTRIKSLEGIVK